MFFVSFHVSSIFLLPPFISNGFLLGGTFLPFDWPCFQPRASLVIYLILFLFLKLVYCLKSKEEGRSPFLRTERTGYFPFLSFFLPTPLDPSVKNSKWSRNRLSLSLARLCPRGKQGNEKRVQSTQSSQKSPEIFSPPFLLSPNQEKCFFTRP